MVDRADISDGMEVVGSDGVGVGRVADVESGRILLSGGAADGTGARSIPLSHVRRVEGGRVHLLDSAAVETGGLGARIAEATGDPMPDAPRAPAGRRLLLWGAGGVLILVLLFAIFQCTDRQQRRDLGGPPQVERGDVSPVGTGGAQPVAPPNGRQVPLAPGSLALRLRDYLADPNAAAGRSFPFERVLFDTGSAALRPAERAGVAELGQVLAAYPSALVRVVGHTDERGPPPANRDLGRERAEAVAAALTAAGAERARIETASEGEGSPAATNADAQGQARNRRTELIVTAR